MKIKQGILKEGFLKQKQKQSKQLQKQHTNHPGIHKMPITKNIRIGIRCFE